MRYLTTLSIISGIIISLYGSEIKDYLSQIRLPNKRTVTIKSGDDIRYVNAIDTELINELDIKHVTIKDGLVAPSNGKYFLHDTTFIKTNDAYIISSKSNTLTLCHEIYNKYYGPDNCISFYTIKDGHWVFSCARSRKSLDSINSNSSVEEVMKLDYNRQLGLLFHSEPGKGKSLMVEVLASELSRPVYIFNVNSHKLCDADILNLIMTIPPNSILLFEELDLQLETMKSNYVTIGGLLSAMDGPARRADNNVMIITTNNYNNLVELFPNDTLIRPGRIDQVIEF